MSQLAGESARQRSFFQTPAFWIGSLLWLVVLLAGLVVWSQKQKQKAAAGAGNGPNVVTNDVSSDDSAGPPRQIKITTDKDGNAKVVLPGENPDSPWDKDGIADFEFTDTEGKTVTKADLLGKPWIVCFVFTHCAATCPTVTLAMRDLQDSLKKYDFRLVTLTVDPVRDTPEVLREYGKSRGADFSKWSFLTGDQRDVYRLIHGSFKMPVQELQGEKRQLGFEFIHSNNIMLVDDKGIVKGKFDATKGPAMAELRREIPKLAKPMAAGQGEEVKE